MFGRLKKGLYLLLILLATSCGGSNSPALIGPLLPQAILAALGNRGAPIQSELYETDLGSGTPSAYAIVTVNLGDLPEPAPNEESFLDEDEWYFVAFEYYFENGEVPAPTGFVLLWYRQFGSQLSVMYLAAPTEAQVAETGLDAEDDPYRLVYVPNVYALAPGALSDPASATGVFTNDGANTNLFTLSMRVAGGDFVVTECPNDDDQSLTTNTLALTDPSLDVVLEGTPPGGAPVSSAISIGGPTNIGGVRVSVEDCP